MWIVRDVGGGSYHMERGRVVDYNCDKLKDVDGDKVPSLLSDLNQCATRSPVQWSSHLLLRGSYLQTLLPLVFVVSGG